METMIFLFLRKRSKVYDAKYGFCQFIDRQKYIEGGLENEGFVVMDMRMMKDILGFIN